MAKFCIEIQIRDLYIQLLSQHCVWPGESAFLIEGGFFLLDPIERPNSYDKPAFYFIKY
jgi:hypothetical protein